MRYPAKYNLALLVLNLVLTPQFMSGQTQSGTLDTSFGTAGRVVTDFGNVNVEAHSVVVQPDGKLVAAGFTTDLWNQSDFALARYNSNGTLDSSFGMGGKVTTNFVDFDYLTSMALQSDGRIVVAGSIIVNNSPDFALLRYNSNGTLDATFGSGGRVSTRFGGPAQPYGVAIQSDGKIVATGYAHLSEGWSFALVRYNSNGTLDATFGTGGKTTTPFGVPSVAGTNSLRIQRDGKIVVAGATFVNNVGNFALARYNSNGTLDTTFGTGGRVVTDFGADDHVFSVALQADGKIVAAGIKGADFALARYNTNGTLDGTFGTGGKVVTDFAGSGDLAMGVAIRPDGKIVAVGRTSVPFPQNSAFAVARYNSNGTLDTSFGNGGKATTSFVGSSGDQAFSVAIQSDGKTVVGGSAIVNLSNQSTLANQFALARYR
jgi:uncharacterized delta-60 repeat protein